MGKTQREKRDGDRGDKQGDRDAETGRDIKWSEAKGRVL